MALCVLYEGSCLTSYRTRSATLPLSEPLPTTTTGHYSIQGVIKKFRDLVSENYNLLLMAKNI